MYQKSLVRSENNIYKYSGVAKGGAREGAPPKLYEVGSGEERLLSELGVGSRRTYATDTSFKQLNLHHDFHACQCSQGCPGVGAQTGQSRSSHDPQSAIL